MLAWKDTNIDTDIDTDNGSSEGKMVARSAKSIGVVHKHRPIVDNFRQC